MAIEIINVGTSPNDGNGDPIRDAFIKCNDNFDELDTTKIGGSGTDNYVPKFNGTDAIENSQIFDNGTNVGIGTTNSFSKLEIVGLATSWADSPSIIFSDNAGTINSRRWLIGNVATDYGSLNFAVSSTNSNDPTNSKMTITKEGNVGIGLTNPSSSAILHLKSNSKGFLPPTMSTSERDSIGGPENGLIIFNEDSQTIEVYTTAGWKSLLYI